MVLRTISKSRSNGTTSSRGLSLDLIPDPFIILKSDGEIFDLNQSCRTLLGAKKSQLLKRNFKELKKFSILWKKIEQTVLEKKESTERMAFDGRNYEIYILPYKAGVNIYRLRIIFKDITNFLRLEAELLKRNKELIIMNNLSSAFISSDNLDLAMEDLMDKIFLITDFHTGWLLLKENSKLSLRTSRGISSEVKTRLEEGALASLCANTIQMRESLSVLEADELSQIPFLAEQGIVFLVIIPLLSEESTSGLLFLASGVKRNVDLEFASLMALVGNHLTHIIGKIKLFQETKRLSVTDALTGLYNTRYFYKTLELEIARTNRYGTPFSLMLFDIDDFKLLNDNYGHQAGDEVLQELAQILKSISRETDINVRYGGEEFIIVLPNTLEKETIFLAERIRKSVHEHSFIVSATEKVNITLSGGIASYPKNAGHAKSLLNAADTALYSAKAAGKNVVICYEGYNQ